MNQADFSFIESHLHVVLPNIFKRFMLKFPRDASLRLVNCSEIATNAEQFVIEQLRLIHNDRGFDFYQDQPELRDHRFVQVGGDGCGNIYFMPGNDATSNDLWLWEHDPPNGFGLVTHMTLGDHLGPVWRLIPQADPLAEFPSAGRVVCRTDHPYRSILAPITMQEWQAYIEADPCLTLDENLSVPNPFKPGELLVIPRWPGRAMLTIGGSSAHIEYRHGCLSLIDECPLAAHLAYMRRIAEDLNANVI